MIEDGRETEQVIDGPMSLRRQEGWNQESGGQEVSLPKASAEAGDISAQL